MKYNSSRDFILLKKTVNLLFVSNKHQSDTILKVPKDKNDYKVIKYVFT